MEDIYYFRPFVNGKKEKLRLDQTNPHWVNGLEPLMVLKKEALKTKKPDCIYHRMIVNADNSKAIETWKDDEWFYIQPHFTDDDGIFSIFIAENTILDKTCFIGDEQTLVAIEEKLKNKNISREKGHLYVTAKNKYFTGSISLADGVM